MNPTARRLASPYARRLARERGFALASVTGTGPGGRIVAADIDAFVAAPPAKAPAPTAMAVSAFATAVDLQKLQHLLAEFATTGISLGLDDMLVRAAALALEAVGAGNATPSSPPLLVAWETGGAADRREIPLTDAHKGLVSALHDRLAAALAEPEAAVSTRPAGGLSLRRLGQPGIRPTAMPLLPGYAMRLVVSTPDSGGTADCLLCFDAQEIGEDDAASLLARFRDGLETPLRLLA